ncbi:MAG TPA: tRNA pseudouridine(13) synthase TruD, partial [Planctomycetaceae bacterium]|nr:tRNA pseudouridine(13) synthase TruD [Planctomycetaceae bacterium]HRA90016.1 tRNA pseudouridine(13) synthase TruD [Planctomycetaceae bacterium]
MKLRRLPEDFRVEELTSIAASNGAFALYRLTKTSIGTPEAISAIVERWKVQRKRISYGGLKDR